MHNQGKAYTSEIEIAACTSSTAASTKSNCSEDMAPIAIFTKDPQ